MHSGFSGGGRVFMQLLAAGVMLTALALRPHPAHAQSQEPAPDEPPAARPARVRAEE